jgi:hypothetical protein
MGINISGGGGGTDWSLFTPISDIQANHHVAVTDTWEDILNVSGEGFLSHAQVTFQRSSSDLVELEIILDGETVYHADYNLANANLLYGGLYNPRFQPSGGSSIAYVIHSYSGGLVALGGMDGGVFPLPISFSNLGTIAFAVLDYPLFFNVSCQIRVKHTSTSDGIGYMYVGGVLG